MLTLGRSSFPRGLTQMPDPPDRLYLYGEALSSFRDRTMLAVVGSRKITPYGRHITAELTGRLAEQGIIIVSGLAYGVDVTAHLATLEAGGTTIAVLPGPVDAVVPAAHRRIAERIVAKGGALVSEYPPDSPVFKQNFIARNRIVAGLAGAVLITEAAEKSGALHTARFALEQGKEVLAVPGNITSEASTGTNNLIRAGAVPVTDYRDILLALGFEPEDQQAFCVVGADPEEQAIIDLLVSGVADGEELQIRSKLGVSAFNRALTMLEISGKIRAIGGNRWHVSR